jgi:hypothetical protein
MRGSPCVLEAPHDRERPFFVSGETQELAVLVDGPEAAMCSELITSERLLDYIRIFS